MVSFSSSGDWSATTRWLALIQRGAFFQALDQEAQQGTDALRAATPVDSGLTAESWTHRVQVTPGSARIVWSNTNIHEGVNIAVILQYGHGTGTGGYVQGRDYINPAIHPVFDEIANNVWRAVTSG